LLTTVKYSLQLLEDANGFENWIKDIAGLRVAGAVEYTLTLGKDNGTNTALPNSPTGGLLTNVTTGATTSSLAAGIIYANLVALAGSVDHVLGYRAYMSSGSVHNYLLTQVDSTGRPSYVNAAMPAYNAARLRSFSSATTRVRTLTLMVAA
jgi:HK97 family phage major capsid protein